MSGYQHPSYPLSGQCGRRSAVWLLWLKITDVTGSFYFIFFPTSFLMSGAVNSSSTLLPNGILCFPLQATEVEK